jgi:hypothetical protein
MTSEWIHYAGYDGCVALTNADVRVTLGPQCGGRVLEYAWRGENALWLDPQQDGWMYRPGEREPHFLYPCGGRCDIGPEMSSRRTPELWLGQWQAEITGPLIARMTSAVSETVGVQLTREYTLAADSSHLTCTQTMRNISERITRWCYWCRIFGRGRGICIVPLTPELFALAQAICDVRPGRGPSTCGPKTRHPRARRLPGGVRHAATPSWGWILTPAGSPTGDQRAAVRQALSRRPERVYNEAAGLTLSLWFIRDLVCELEPNGPMEVLQPGQAASLTEEWWLAPLPLPAQRDAADGADRRPRAADDAG